MRKTKGLTILGDCRWNYCRNHHETISGSHLTSVAATLLVSGTDKPRLNVLMFACQIVPVLAGGGVEDGQMDLAQDAAHITTYTP